MVTASLFRTAALGAWRRPARRTCTMGRPSPSNRQSCGMEVRRQDRGNCTRGWAAARNSGCSLRQQPVRGHSPRHDLADRRSSGRIGPRTMRSGRSGSGRRCFCGQRSNILSYPAFNPRRMTSDHDTSQATLAAVRDWYARLPAGVASVTQNETKYEQVIRITPAAVGASWVEFRIAPYGKMDVFFGHAGNHEEVDASPETAIEVCEAARRGRITEETRTWRGRRLSTLTVMHLPSLWSAGAQRCHVGQWRDAGSPRRQLEKCAAGVPIR
jgi:hypothetical protein